MSFKLQSISAEAHELEAKVEAAEGRATKIAQVIAKHVEEIAKEIGGYVTISGGGHLNSVEGQPGDSVWLNVNSLPNPAKPTPSGLIPPEASGANPQPGDGSPAARQEAVPQPLLIGTEDAGQPPILPDRDPATQAQPQPPDSQIAEAKPEELAEQDPAAPVSDFPLVTGDASTFSSAPVVEAPVEPATPPDPTVPVDPEPVPLPADAPQTWGPVEPVVQPNCAGTALQRACAAAARTRRSRAVVPDREAIQQGLDFEKTVSESLGLDLTVASGNRWDDRGDGRGRGLRVSCKSNPVSRRSWSQTREQLNDALDMAGGSGQLGVLCIEDQDGARLVLLRLEDFAEVLQGNHAQAPPQRRSERVRAAASIPLLRRQQSE